MAKLVTKYYEVQDDPKPYINPLVGQCLECGRALIELNPDEVDNSVLYHLSQERQNILSWFPFSSESRVLELGAGSGAITGMLSQRVASVDAFDLSMEMCKLNAQRNKNMDNITIVAGNIFTIQWDRQYDYIVVTDDFLNAERYHLGKRAYFLYLQNLKELLKENGHLLLAMGNRLGLQYLTGAPDSCSGAYFEGIKRYPQYRSRREFSRSEILGMVEDLGYQIQRWYYPYPNHIYPNEIFTHDSIEKNGYGRFYNNFCPGRLELYREDLLAKDMLREGTMEAHVNSFLLDLTLDDKKSESHILYAKMNQDRKEKFRIATIIEKGDGDKSVRKQALTWDAVSHLRKMYEYETRERQGEYPCLAGRWLGDGISYPYLEGDSLDEKVEQWITDGDVENILSQVRSAIEGIAVQTEMIQEEMYNDIFYEWFGTECVSEPMECIKPANIDLILGNILVKDGQYVTIDNEWIVDTWVPKKFILWRCINELIYGHPAIEDLMTRRQIYDELAISIEEAIVFDEWNHHFVEKFVMANQMHRYQIPARCVCLEKDLDEKNGMTSSLYLDYGQGYNEKDKIVSYQLLEGNTFRLVFDIPDSDKVKRIRWDPLEGSICRTSVLICKGNDHMRIAPVNAYEQTQMWDEFANTDPQYEIPKEYISEGRLILCGKLEYLSHREIEDRYLSPNNIVERLGTRIHKRIRHDK